MFFLHVFLTFSTVFFTFSKSEIINCEFQMKAFESLGNLYQCQGKILNSGEENFVENVIGQHTYSRSNENVQSLDLIHQNLKKIPENLHNIFSNLIRIYVAHSNLISLTAEDLKNFPELRVLDVWNNKVATLPADLFKFTPKIQRFSVAKNPLQSVGEGVLDGLTDLQSADFRHTHCIDFKAKTEYEIRELERQLIEKCSEQIEISDEPAENLIEFPVENKKIAAEVSELRDHFFLQSQTIIAMAQEVIEHKEALQSQAENFAGLVSEATRLIMQVIEVMTVQDKTIEGLEDTIEEQDEAIEKLEERLTEVEERLGMIEKENKVKA